jgi:FlaA1/EpsC-like NDP-sugar epimerase
MMSTILTRRFVSLRRLGLDVVACALAFLAIIVLPAVSLGYSLLSLYATNLPRDMAIFCVIAFATLSLLRVYRMIWRYASFRDILQLTRATLVMVVAFYAVELVLHPQMRTPSTLWTPVGLFVTTLIFLVTPRMLVRAFSESRLMISAGKPAGAAGRRIRVLMVGDVDRIEAFIRDTFRNPRSEYQVVGVFADDPKLYGGYLHGVPVIGPVQEIAKSVDHLRKRRIDPQMLVLAREQPERSEFERLLDLVSGLALNVGQLPPMSTMHDGTPVQPVVIADLLGRPEIRLDNSQLESMISGRNILITGAGGSIGSELSRQVAALKPANVVLADACEFNLYRIEMEFQEKFPDVAYKTALLDVRDTALVLQWIRKFRPDIVFHAAALKHVPLLEDHPIEAVKTNVLGTVNVADACFTCGVPLMVTISTDKAVNPFNIMGATKRLAEAYCQGVDQNAASNTRYVTVRFGNVLGSAGSVVPLFQRQIEEGGPVTVTHPDITRYFMTIPEAVCLVLQASAQGKIDEGDRGSIYVLDMGKPIKIMDLARQMIRLSGKRPDIDIEIKVVGLRPGEKLYEEVVHAEEGVSETPNKSVFKVSPRVSDLRILQQQIQELRLAAAASDAARVPRLLTIAVPEFGEMIKRQPKRGSV